MDNSGLDKFVQDLHLPYKCELVEDKYILRMRTSNQFSRVYNIIANNDKLFCDDAAVADDNVSQNIYTDYNYDIVLTAMYDKDIYLLEIGER